MLAYLDRIEGFCTEDEIERLRIHTERFVRLQQARMGFDVESVLA